MLGLSSSEVRFGLPPALTSTVVVGLVMIAVGLIGIVLTTRRMNTLRKRLPPSVPPGATKPPPFGILAYGVLPWRIPRVVRYTQQLLAFAIAFVIFGVLAVGLYYEV
jgi:hypothetical protein